MELIPQRIIKPGIKTSEFWWTVAETVAWSTGTLAGVLEPKTAAILTTISVSLYKIVRMFAKR